MYCRLLLTAMRSRSIPFHGEPAVGLQVMGLLETRNLDFENVVMLSVNEGVLPSGRNDNSLILYEIKKRFHLSTYEQNDAIYGYHFFHLLQRATDIHLIYNADSSDAVAEESRFIKQISFKKRKGQYDNITLEQIVKPPLPIESGQDTASEIVIANSKAVQEKLKKFQFSASSLSTYINCPLQFYLKYVAQIVPEEEIDENVEQNVIGLVIHTALEQLGKAIIENPGITPAELVDEWMEKIKGDYILDLFNEREEVRGQDLMRGRLYLATEVVRKTLAAYLPQLRDELASGRIQIIGCERQFSCPLDVGGTPVGSPVSPTASTCTTGKSPSSTTRAASPTSPPFLKSGNFLPTLTKSTSSNYSSTCYCTNTATKRYSRPTASPTQTLKPASSICATR